MSRVSSERGRVMGMEQGGSTSAMPAAMMPIGMGMMNPAMSGMMMGGMGSMPMSANMGAGMMMAPRCTMKVEMMEDGMRMTCMTDDAMARGMMQNLCMMMPAAMCSCVMMMNGMPMMTCNLAMGMCRCEMSDQGMTLTCTSGDKACRDMMAACMDAMMAMMSAGCMCCLMMNGMPVCISM